MSQARAYSLEELKALVHSNYKEKEVIPSTAIPQGLPKGGVVEVSGNGKTEFIVQFLSENPQLRAVWLESGTGGDINPYGIFQRKTSLSRILFVQPEREAVWTLLQVLRSSLFGAVIVDDQRQRLPLRALQLAAEKAKASVFLLSETLQKNAWSLSMQVRTEKIEGQLHIHVVRQR